jgi:hypothetical protein
MLGVSASIVLIYLALDRIERLEERHLAMEQTIANLSTQIAQFSRCEHSSLPVTHHRRNSSQNAVDETGGDPSAENQRSSLQLSPTYSLWLYRIVSMRWAIQARERSFFDKVGIYEEASDGPDNQLETLPVLTNQGHSPLCLTCISHLTSGKFEPQLNGVREHRRILSIFFKARISAIQESAEAGCTICKIILTTLQDAEDFAIQAKASGLNDEECFGMSACVGRAMEALAISLNLYGTVQSIMVFQIEMQNNVGASILGPYFKMFLDRGTLSISVIYEIQHKY